MATYKFCLVILCVTSYVTGQIIQPCKMNDDVCVLKSVQAAYPLLATGVPTGGKEVSDPLKLDFVFGSLSILNYTLIDTSIEGFKNCHVDDFKLDLNQWVVKMELTCPLFNIHGNYVIDGRLIILPIEGNGTYTIVAKNYNVEVNSEIKKSMGKDGVEHLSIKNFQVKSEAMDGVVYSFQNLFNGNKELSDTIHKFANENWKEVTEFVQGPVFNTAVKKLISYANKYLKTIPFNDLFIQ